MEQILLLLSFFAVIKSLFMTSLLPNRWYRLAFSLLLGGFVVVCHPYAMETNKLELQKLVSTQSAILNISLFVMVDMLLSGYFCVTRICDWEESRSSQWYARVFRYMPSPLIFPALYYIHINLFFSLTGIEFVRTSIGLALSVAFLFGMASFFLRKWMGGKDLLIELVALLTLLVCALVICCTIFHPSAAVYNHANPVDWTGCAGTIGFFILLISAGYIWTSVVRLYKRFKNIK